MKNPRFSKIEIGELENDISGGAMNTLICIGDINSDGRPDIVVAGRNGHMAWFQNPGDTSTQWTRHIVSDIRNSECGGLTFDLTGNGFPDIINGGDWQSDELSWWENGGDASTQWTRHIIAKTGHTQFHDEAIGDVTGDDTLSLVFWNQGSASLHRVPIPADVRQSPWSNIETIACNCRENGQAEEGLCIIDLDGDGQNEIVAGTHWYKYSHGAWQNFKFASNYITTVIAVADLDGDGELEIVLSEGDACIYGHPEGGKLAYFKRGSDIQELWQENLLSDGLRDPHSLQIGDICGNGFMDIVVGEIGVADTLHEAPPRLWIYQNDGRGNFTPHLIDEGTGTHHARLVDLRGNGKLDIVSRPLHGPNKWKVYAWLNES